MGCQPSNLFIGLQTEHFLGSKFLPKRFQPTVTRGKKNRISIMNEVALKANISEMSHGETEYLRVRK